MRSEVGYGIFIKTVLISKYHAFLKGLNINVGNILLLEGVELIICREMTMIDLTFLF